MPRKLVSKTSFLGGEAGYLLEGRSDLAQHQLGASLIQNFLVTKGGAATRRPGTRYVFSQSSYCRLLDYVISYDSADKIFLLKLTYTDSTHIDVAMIRTSDNATMTLMGGPIQTDEAITEADINEIQYAQIGATMLLTHRSFSPKIVRQISTTGFSLDDYIGYINSGTKQENTLPYRDPNITATTLTLGSASVGATTVTASADLFDAGHINSWWRFYSGGSWGAFYITHVTDTKHANVTVTTSPGAATASAEWQECSWSVYRGWPRTITLYNQRTVFGGNTSEPDTFWASNTDNYFWMSINGTTTVTADTPQVFTLASTKLNQIRWMVGGKKLTIGTSSSEWVGYFTESSDGLSTIVQFNEETTHGSSYVQARRSGMGVPFVQRSKKAIREIVFDFYSDTYVATDLTLFGSHLGTGYGEYEGFDPTIMQVAYQESPINIIWVLDSVGRLYGLTRDKEQQIAAWHSHEFGGTSSGRTLFGVNSVGGTYPAQVVNMCVVPSVGGETDNLYLVVRRTDNLGTDTYYVEYIDDVRQNVNLSLFKNSEIQPFLDCATYHTRLSTDSASWTTGAQFANTTARFVAVNGGGSLFSGSVAVDGSGNFTLPAPARRVVMGYHANAEIRLLPFEGGGDGQPFYMRSKKRADQIALRLYQTLGLMIGKDRILRKDGWEQNDTDFQDIPFTMDQPALPTFTGIKEVNPPTDVDFDGTFALVMQDPWPCTILSICSRVVENEV